MFKRLLTMRGIHFFATRYCGATIRKWAFDEKYKSGEWKFTEGQKSELVDALQQYAADGSILMLGCGTASITGCLNLEKLKYICGVDLSPVAISMATEKYGGKKVEFEVADILEYQCRRNYDVILFSESFNYIKDPDQKGLLDRLCQNLNPGGCIIVTLSNPDRYQAIINLINRNFEVLKEGKFKDSNRYITIFKKRAVDK